MAGIPPGTWLGGIAQSLFATIFPSDCRICGSFLTNISRLPACVECLSAMLPMQGTFCTLCGERLPGTAVSDAESALCAICHNSKPFFARAAAYGSYDAGLRELIHLLKYERVTPAAKTLGNMLAGVIADMHASLGGGPILVVPVPLHAGKRRERGFNQAELIACQAVKKSSGKRLNLNTHVLKRRRPTESQIGLSQQQRKENLRGAFQVQKTERVAGCEVLLVDDVFTTGTTASECARVLLRAGATKVWVATVARTLKMNIHHGEEFENIAREMAG